MSSSDPNRTSDARVGFNAEVNTRAFLIWVNDYLARGYDCVHASRKSLLEDMGGTNDQIDRFWCLLLGRHNVSTSNASRSGSCAGRNDDRSRLRMRTVQDTS